ncbi:MAG TPA: ABC transporter substrate-binding protein [Methylomirabilota bacterium]|nr:ABC transporter substrate-binding protein [Methylomirabilota bacterium]
MIGLIVLLQALTVAVSGPPSSPEYLPLHVAAAEGYFTREGLDVTLKSTRAEPGAAEALSQGQTDLAATSLDAVLRFGPRGASQAPRIVLGLTAAPPVALVVPASQKEIVKSIEDVVNTRVGISTPGAPEQAWFAWLLARSGLSVAQVWIISHGGRGLLHAMETGDVHAGLVHEPYASRLLADGQTRLLADLRSPAAVAALGPLTLNAAVFARSDRRPRDRDLTAFARAVLAAERRIAAADPRELATRLPRRIVAPPEDFADRVAALRTLYLPDGVVTAAQVQETIALSRGHHPLPVTARVPRAEELLLMEPLRRALAAPAPR